MKKWFFFSVVLTLAILPVISRESDFSTAKNHFVKTVQESLQMNEALGVKCELSSAGLAKCFSERLNVVSISGSTLTTSDGAVWNFDANPYCTASRPCNVVIDVNGASGPNVSGKDRIKIPMYMNSKGYLYVDNK